MFGLAYAILLGPQLKLDDVLLNARAASGYSRMPSGGLRCSGVAHRNGVSGVYKLLFTPDGRFFEAFFGSGPGTTLVAQAGYDGSTTWIEEWSGFRRKADLEDRESALADAWIWSGRWMQPGGPFEISLDPSQTTPKSAALTLRLKGGLYKGTLTLDRQRWLPTRFTRLRALGKETVDFGNYKIVGGVAVARSQVRTEGGVTSRIAIDSVTPLKLDTRSSPFRYVERAPQDATFNPTIPAQVKSKFLPIGLTLVKPRVNGRDVGWFLLDSGAGSLVLDSRVARTLGLKKFGEIPVVGVGGLLKSNYALGDRFQLGQLEIKRPIFVELDFSQLSKAIGSPISGIAGWEVFCRSTVEMDFPGKAVRVYNPATARADDANWSPLRFTQNHSAMTLRYEGDRQGLFRVDTGSSLTLTFHGPTVNRLKLLEGRKTGRLKLGGVGASAMDVAVGVLDWIELGGKRLETQAVTFATSEAGVLGDPYFDGNLGQGLLQKFRVLFDYPRARIGFLPPLPGPQNASLVHWGRSPW